MLSSKQRVVIVSLEVRRQGGKRAKWQDGKTDRYFFLAFFPFFHLAVYPSFRFSVLRRLNVHRKGAKYAKVVLCVIFAFSASLRFWLERNFILR